MSENLHTPLVKICGISDPHHALVALDAGADFIGLVFYPGSSRYVSHEQARQIVEVVRAVDPDKNMRIVGLFVDQTAESMNQTAADVGLDMIQLSGNEPAQIVFKLRYPTLGSVRIRKGEWPRAAARLRDWLLVAPDAVHVDTEVSGKFGGTGEVGDWEIAGQIAVRFRTFFSGGLNPGNVVKAAETVKPFAVDVSSGVETNGKKDEQKIRAFIRNAKTVSFVIPEMPMPVETGSVQ